MPDRESRKRAITARRREQILKAAMQIFSDKGYAAATIPEIAGAAGTASGTIYLYFDSKHELFISVIKELVVTMPILNLIGSLSDSNIEAIFRSVLENRLNLIEGDKISQLVSLMSEIQRDPELRVMFREELIHPFMSTMEGLWGTMLKDRESPFSQEFEPAFVVRAVGGTILGFMMLRIFEGETSPMKTVPREKEINNLMTYIFHGLLKEKTDLQASAVSSQILKTNGQVSKEEENE